jgi:hypothetical protein
MPGSFLLKKEFAMNLVQPACPVLPSCALRSLLPPHGSSGPAFSIRGKCPVEETVSLYFCHICTAPFLCLDTQLLALVAVACRS